MRPLPDASSASRRESQPVNRRSPLPYGQQFRLVRLQVELHRNPALPRSRNHGQDRPSRRAHASTVFPAAFSDTECELACAPSLKNRYTFASFSRRVITFSAVSGVSSATSRALMTVLSAVSIAAGTTSGPGGAAGACRRCRRWRKLRRGLHRRQGKVSRRRRARIQDRLVRDQRRCPPQEQDLSAALRICLALREGLQPVQFRLRDRRQRRNNHRPIMVAAHRLQCSRPCFEVGRQRILVDDVEVDLPLRQHSLARHKRSVGVYGR